MTYTSEEINSFRELCNFTDTERQFFELRLKNKSIVSISMTMNMSESQTSRISKKVKSKITRIRHFLSTNTEI